MSHNNSNIPSASRELPALSNQPRYHPDCCLSLCNPLLQRLSALLATSSIVLSVGCGSGLLEALLQLWVSGTCVEGVETASAQNKYLDEQAFHVASGTWEVHRRSRDADAWMFVYPRVPSLFADYLRHAKSSRVKLVLWIGPKNDWAEFERCLDVVERKRVQCFSGQEIAEYEQLVTIEL
jgi:hypothetical protein